MSVSKTPIEFLNYDLVKLRDKYIKMLKSMEIDQCTDDAMKNCCYEKTFEQIQMMIDDLNEIITNHT